MFFQKLWHLLPRGGRGLALLRSGVSTLAGWELEKKMRESFPPLASQQLPTAPVHVFRAAAD